MNEILELFKNEFISCVSHSNMCEGEEICFGNLDYDFSLFLLDGRYILHVFETALDHYGMPYRNTLSYDVYDVTNLIL
jgi:hypothetical protein